MVWPIYPFHISQPQISTPYPRFKYKPQDVRDDIFIGFTSRYFKYWKRPPARNRKEVQIHILEESIKDHVLIQKILSGGPIFLVINVFHRVQYGRSNCFYRRVHTSISKKLKANCDFPGEAPDPVSGSVFMTIVQISETLLF